MRGGFDLRVLRRILRSQKRYLMSLEHVVGVGIGNKIVRGQDTGKKSIVVFVDKKVPPEDLKRGQEIPVTLQGTETDVIETGPFYLLDRKARQRPAMPGASIGHYKVTAGTFGALVKDKTSGQVLILSNNHVLANATNGSDGRAEIGDPILQPGAHDNGRLEKDVIATLYRFVPIHGLFEESRCPIARAAAAGATGILKTFMGDYRVRLEKEIITENIVDCAVARPIKDEYVGSSVIELGEIDGWGEAELYEVVKKSGRTSGLTRGSVNAVDVTIKVALSEGNQAIFSDQIMTDMVSRPGDSGSVVLNYKNQAVGLLFAGSGTFTLFNRFSNVMRMLDVTL